MTLTDALSDCMRAGFKTAYPELGEAAEKIRAVPTGKVEFGDYQCNDAMSFARILKQPPREIAGKAVGAMPPAACLDRAEVAGAGFINLFVNDAWLTGQLEALESDDRVGVPDIGGGRTVVMDYGSPNITKPLHIGHLRSHNIGSTLDRLHRFLGYRVIADNHLGDWGTQFGITIMGYRHFGDEEAMRRAPLEELERVYVKSYERTKEDPAWHEQCRAELVKLQAGDPDNRALWQTFVRLSMEELDRIYRRLGVSYDLVRGESHYNDKLAPMVAMLEARGMARASEGATVVFLEEEKLPPCIVRKRDGGFNYATSDLATMASRVAEFAPERIVYVTDERQQLHFRQVFAISRRLGITIRLDHVWFGLMRLPEGAISTREGNVIRLDALLDKAEELALALVRTSSPDMDPGQQRDIARAIGIGAVKYADLSQNPQSLVTFTWEKAMALDGNSGPYLQYAYARIASVQDKYRERFPGGDLTAHVIRLTEPTERALALRVAQFPDVVCLAAETKPNVLSDYLFGLAQTFSTFYQNVPFLKADEGVRESRVRLCGAVARVLGKGLHLLGLETPERI